MPSEVGNKAAANLLTSSWQICEDLFVLVALETLKHRMILDGIVFGISDDVTR